MRARDVPRFPFAVRREDEGSLLRAHQNPHATHQTLPRIKSGKASAGYGLFGEITSDADLGHGGSATDQMEGTERLAQVGQGDGENELHAGHRALVRRGMWRVSLGRNRAAAKEVLSARAKSSVSADRPGGIDRSRPAQV